MLVQDFKNNVSQYEEFAVWDIENIDDFFDGNGVIKEIFEKEYGMPLVNFKARRDEIPETDKGLIAAILDLVADKYFFIFTNLDQNHQDLIYMQESKIMSFGINIANVNPSHVFVVMMDKVKKAGLGF